MHDVAPLVRIDSFPYRHRLHEVMSTPVLTATSDLSLKEAVGRMYEARVSSIVVVDTDGRTVGILTERDLLRILSVDGARGLDVALGQVMTRPVATVSGESFVYVALGKMNRLGLRHLVVVDCERRPIGMVTGRALLKVRAGDALVLGDSVQEARGAEDMATVMAALPRLAGGLLSEGVPARGISSVIALVIRDLTARAAELAEVSLADDGWGPPPAPYAVLVLGSAGRGESLLVFDQDNAIVHRGTASDDVWFAELGRRINQMLNDAGIPFCDGGVMARESRWRKNFEDWQSEIHHWVYAVENQTVMYCDIFFDFQAVWGDRALAEELRVYAVGKAAQSAFFMQYLAQHVAKMDVAVGLFGQFQTVQGRLNAKKFALLPLVSAARFRAIRAHALQTGTDERYLTLREHGALHDEDCRDLLDIREIVTRLMLDQQLADLAAGIVPSAKIDPKRLEKQDRERLRWCFRRIKTLKYICGVAG